MEKCHHEKPHVQTFHISDQEHEHKHEHPSISMVLLTGLKYLLGSFAILALPFIVLKALFLPLKFFLFFKALALLKTFLMLTLFMRFLRLNRRIGGVNNNNNNANFPSLFPVRYKKKLQTIKDILNSEEFEENLEDDYRAEDDEILTKENISDDERFDGVTKSAPLIHNNPFNATEISPEFIDNLAKLIKLKSKNW
jgi:hypothetical protein